MAFCINCGQKLTDGAKFCSECGSRISDVQASYDGDRKSVYDGEIHKCPNCGNVVSAYETICKACGLEIRGRKTTSVVHELSLKLEKNEDTKRKDELIRTFYIPNTREDIYEFFILALSNIKIGGMNTNAWMVKLEQAYQKAELSFNDTQEFERLKPMYEKAKILNRKNSALSFVSGLGKYFKSGFAWAVLLGLIGLFFLLVNIAFEVSVLNIIGGGALYVAAVIALMTGLFNAEKKKKSMKQKNTSNGLLVGKDADEFIHQNCDDMVEFLKTQGFMNIVTKAEKKGFLDTEGWVKGISISGDSDFSEDDRYDANSKIIIRYYSRNY